MDAIQHTPYCIVGGNGTDVSGWALKADGGFLVQCKVTACGEGRVTTGGEVLHKGMMTEKMYRFDVEVVWTQLPLGGGFASYNDNTLEICRWLIFEPTIAGTVTSASKRCLLKKADRDQLRRVWGSNTESAPS